MNHHTSKQASMNALRKKNNATKMVEAAWVIQDMSQIWVDNILDPITEWKIRLDVFLQESPQVIDFLKSVQISVSVKPYQDSFYYEIVCPHGKEQIMGNPVQLTDEYIQKNWLADKVKNITLSDGKKVTIFCVIDAYGSELSDILAPLWVTPIGAHSSWKDAILAPLNIDQLDPEIQLTEEQSILVNKNLIKLLNLQYSWIQNWEVRVNEVWVFLTAVVDWMWHYTCIFDRDWNMENIGAWSMVFLEWPDIGWFQVLARPML